MQYLALYLRKKSSSGGIEDSWDECLVGVVTEKSGDGGKMRWRL